MPQMPSNQDDNTHALLIGVDDYKSFNGTTDFDLKGSRNDVLLLASYLVEVLGLRPENIVALTWPRLNVQNFEQHVSSRGSAMGDAVRDIVVDDATGAEVAKRLGWLLDRAHHGGALLAFSGHGAWSKDQGPLLCLTDAVPGFSHGVLSLRDLGHDIKKAGAKDRLIALFDCCHVASPTNHHRRMHAKALPHGGTADDVKGDDGLFNVSNRVILGAKPGKETYQARLGGKWSGGLTFALVTAAERWQGESEMSHGSYKHVMRRTKGTLNALGVPQHPAFRAPGLPAPPARIGRSCMPINQHHRQIGSPIRRQNKPFVRGPTEDREHLFTIRRRSSAPSSPSSGKRTGCASVSPGGTPSQ